MTLLAVFGVQAGIFLVLFPCLQAMLGWSGLRSTLALMPMGLLMSLALFDVFASAERTLHANPGKHGEIPAFELDSTLRFFARQLG